jgi:uridine phosphorylase
VSLKPAPTRHDARELPGRPIHLHPTTDLAERVLLPGDPGRALRLAQVLIDGPKMFNHNRGLWGYTGPAVADGALLTIQSTGMGGPSAAIVIHELISLGARRLLRIGTCGGLDPQLELGQLLVATEAIADDGTSRALGAGQRVPGSPGLLAALLETAGAPACGAELTVGPTAGTSGPIISTDLFYDALDRHAGWRALGARAVEMETATLFTLARRQHVEAGAVVLVSDLLDRPGGHARIDDEALIAAETALGHLALTALGRSSAPATDQPGSAQRT